MKMTPEFKNATIYTCDDDQQNGHHDWADAITELILQGEADVTIEDQCKALGPVKVTAFNLLPIPDSWVANQVDNMLENFIDAFNEDFGSDTHDADPWPDDREGWIKKVLVANLSKSIRNTKATKCVQVGEHIFSVTECIKMAS